MDRGSVRTAFEDPAEFTTSPLYRALSRTVVRTDQLLDLAARGRPGQYPTFLFFGAVHLLLLRGADHPLARYYPSVAGDRALPADEAGPALVSFGETFAPELDAIISTRLVQTNHVQRALALRLGLSMIAPAVAGPVHLIEVGTSAGLNLRFDRYGYPLSGRTYGAAGWLGGQPLGAGRHKRGVVKRRRRRWQRPLTGRLRIHDGGVQDRYRVRPGHGAHQRYHRAGVADIDPFQLVRPRIEDQLNVGRISRLADADPGPPGRVRDVPQGDPRLLRG